MTAANPGTERAVLTLALGPELYWNMALNLARSVRRWHGPELAMAIVTDGPRILPADLAGVRVITLQKDELGIGFETKLHLDRLAPAPRTLFIDSDCLVYQRLDTVFARLAGRPVATVGGAMSTGEWFGDVAALCRQLGVAAIPKFNGGLYYLEPGPVATRVYEQARALAARYDALGLVRLRGRANDELLMASAMALAGLQAVADDGTFMSDPLACPGPMRLNILRGTRVLTNPPPPSPQHQPWYPFTQVSPAIVHFLGYHAARPVYRREARRLRLAARGWPVAIADLAARVLGFPAHAIEWTKEIFRPMFHQLFGRRRVRRTER